jgi:predicted glutamine amidotransferase
MQPLAPKPSEAGLTKAWVLFHNGNKKDFRSFDTSGRYSVADPRSYGIRGLKKMVEKFGVANVKEARLYDTATGREIEKLQDGQWVASSL